MIASSFTQEVKHTIRDENVRQKMYWEEEGKKQRITTERINGVCVGGSTSSVLRMLKDSYLLKSLDNYIFTRICASVIWGKC